MLYIKQKKMLYIKKNKKKKYWQTSKVYFSLYINIFIKKLHNCINLQKRKKRKRRKET